MGSDCKSGIYGNIKKHELIISQISTLAYKTIPK